MLLHLTPPRVVCGYPINSNDVDQFFALFCMYIANNRDAWMEIMDIAYALYEGKNVILLMGTGDIFRDNFTVVLQKYFLDIFGYVSNIVVDPVDLDTLVDGTFSISGLSELDCQKERYIALQSSEYGLDCGKGLDDYD